MSIPRERLQQQTQQTARATLAGARQAGADAPGTEALAEEQS